MFLQMRHLTQGDDSLGAAMLVPSINRKSKRWLRLDQYQPLRHHCIDRLTCSACAMHRAWTPSSHDLSTRPGPSFVPGDASRNTNYKVKFFGQQMLLISKLVEEPCASNAVLLAEHSRSTFFYELKPKSPISTQKKPEIRKLWKLSKAHVSQKS